MMKTGIQTINPNFFRSVTAITVLIGFLSIQFHSFVHHHADDHYPASDYNHELSGEVLSDSESDDHNLYTVDCTTCVLTKHIDSKSYNGNFLYSVENKLGLLTRHFEYKEDLYYSYLSLRGPPSVV